MMTTTNKQTQKTISYKHKHTHKTPKPKDRKKLRIFATMHSIMIVECAHKTM